MKNEIKLINLVEGMKQAKKNYLDFRHHEDGKEYMHHFTEEDLQKIKELIKI
jgi:hypothetical protein